MNMNNFKLDNEPKIRSGFIIPEHYFDDFSNKTTSQLTKKQPKVISIWDKNKRWLYSVAAVIVLSLSLPLANRFKDIAATDSTEIENYLSYHSTLSDDDIINLLEKEDIDKIDVTGSFDEKTIEEALYNTAEIENYITN